MIWIIGEYAERIDNAAELLESFLEGFHDENTQVQLQLLTAIVKLFLKRPNDAQALVQKVLSLATQVRLIYRIYFKKVLQNIQMIKILIPFMVLVVFCGAVPFVYQNNIGANSSREICGASGTNGA